jgi:hypothetical protein
MIQFMEKSMHFLLSFLIGVCLDMHASSISSSSSAWWQARMQAASVAPHLLGGRHERKQH